MYYINELWKCAVFNLLTSGLNWEIGFIFFDEKRYERGI
jgi:hypothetical protein